MLSKCLVQDLQLTILHADVSSSSISISTLLMVMVRHIAREIFEEVLDFGAFHLLWAYFYAFLGFYSRHGFISRAVESGNPLNTPMVVVS